MVPSMAATGGAYHHHGTSGKIALFICVPHAGKSVA
jgi:hypothetical protein